MKTMAKATHTCINTHHHKSPYLPRVPLETHLIFSHRGLFSPFSFQNFSHLASSFSGSSILGFFSLVSLPFVRLICMVPSTETKRFFSPDRGNGLQSQGRKASWRGVSVIAHGPPDYSPAQPSSAPCSAYPSTPPPLHPFSPLSLNGFLLLATGKPNGYSLATSPLTSAVEF